MDFHRLPRRALQFLCKRNSIRANITSVAMAEALRSLQAVEGLNELEQNPETPTIKTLTRHQNPPRSCKRNSTLTSTKSPITKMEVEGRAVQGSLDGSTPKRSRTFRPRKASKRKSEEDPIGHPLPKCSANSMLRCSSSVRQNATSIESDESGIAKVGVVYERRRSIGIQVDIGDHIVTNGPQNSVHFSHCLELDKSDHSCIVSAKRLLDEEFSNSSCLQNLQISTHLAQQSPVSSNMAADVCDPISSQQIPLLAVGDQITKSHEIDASVGGLAGSCGAVLENRNGEKDIGGENEEGKHCGGTWAGSKVSSCTQNSPEFIRCIDLVKKDNERFDSSGLQSLQVATHLPEQSPERSSMPSIDVDHFGAPHAPVPENGDPMVKYHELNVSVGAVVLNCDPISENRVGIHYKNGQDNEMVAKNEEAKSGGGMRVEIKVEKKSEKNIEKMGDLSGLSLRKLRLLYKENKNVIKLEAEEGTVLSEEEKPKVNQTKLDGLSLRKLKILYKDKVNNNSICEVPCCDEDLSTCSNRTSAK